MTVGNVEYSKSLLTFHGSVSCCDTTSSFLFDFILAVWKRIRSAKSKDYDFIKILFSEFPSLWLSKLLLSDLAFQRETNQKLCFRDFWADVHALDDVSGWILTSMALMLVVMVPAVV